MIKNKTAFVTFFPVLPNNMGSSEVVTSRFKSWPYNKKLFQISHLKVNHQKIIQTIFIKKEKPIYKIINLPKLIIKIYEYLKNSKNKYLVLEGASWIFYSFVVLISIKIIFPKCKIIYISHSIESEIRKKYSNYCIYLLTYILEKYVLKNANISTSVSEKEKNKIKKMYNVNTILYPNGVNIKFKKKNINKNYIIYTGSYNYKPNKDAIDFLNHQIMPVLIRNYTDLKLVITGGGYKKKFPWEDYKGIVNKNYLYNLLVNSKCLCVPLKFGSGTRIKIIEALSLGCVVISSAKGIEGLKLKKKDPPYIYKSSKELIKTISNMIKDNKKAKKRAYIDKDFYINNYSMKKITEQFISKHIEIK